MEFLQLNCQVVDISNWHVDEEYKIYPEGKREKTLIYCPSPAPFDFLKENYKYLFKLSRQCFEEQFWIEIFAFLLGERMQIEVPETFVAYNKKSKQCGALIKWFYNDKFEEHLPGGDICKMIFEDYDTKKGTQHNLQMIIYIMKLLEDKFPLTVDWKAHWAKAFLFDSLIGNTDRHQDNWGVILTFRHNALLASGHKYTMRLTPIYDNGTSMGHEIPPNKFTNWKNAAIYENYIGRGTHHMRLSLHEERVNHVDFIKSYIGIFPETRNIMLNCLDRVDTDTFVEILQHLASFDVPVKLTNERVNFMVTLLNMRYKKLRNVLEGFS